MRTGVLLAFAALALAPCFVGAQQCGSVFVGRAPIHCAPAYVAPVAFVPAYAAPVYNTLQLLATPVVVHLPYPTYTVATITPQAFVGGGAYATGAAPVATGGVNVGASAPAVPAYAAGGVASATTNGSELSLLLAEIRALRKDLMRGQLPLEPEKAPKMPPADTPEEPVGALPPIASVLGKCVACHDGAVAAKKGGEFTLFNAGTTVAMTNVQARAVLDRTKKGEMPPTGHPALTPPEYRALEKWIGPTN